MKRPKLTRAALAWAAVLALAWWNGMGETGDGAAVALAMAVAALAGRRIP